MPNPSLLLVDSDALIQILIADVTVILRKLKSKYGIQPTVVPEVELEVLSSRRFGNRFRVALNKSISTGTIAVLDAATYQSLLVGNPVLQSAAIGTSYNDIQSRGAAYSKRIDIGEAYTFAAAVTLSQPAASNDRSAIDAMNRAGLQLPMTVLRAYDLFVFASQSGILPATDCELIRKALLAETEFVPAQQMNCSFRDGVQYFQPRLIDGSKPTIGLQASGTNTNFTSPIIINPIA